MDMRERSAVVDGIRMRWQELGSGVPVVFVHGIPTGPSLWRHVLPRIDGARGLAWEMVGYGGSMREGRDRDISVARQADYLASWMRELELGSGIVVGHDLGGGVAQILAVRYPELARGLVLTNAISYDCWPIPRVKVMQALAPLMERLPPIAAWAILALLMFQGHRDIEQAREALAVHWPHYAESGGMAALMRQVRHLDVQDTLAIVDELSEVELPTRIVWGAADQFLRITYGERLARDLNAPIDRIEEGKHYVPEDFPERVAAAVQDLVETFRGTE